MSSKGSAAPLFAALGDATRLRLLGRLSAGGPLSITRLSEGTGVTRQAITRHLHALGRVGLVRNARRGRERVWDLNRERSEEHTSELQSRLHLVCRLLLEKKKKRTHMHAAVNSLHMIIT